MVYIETRDVPSLRLRNAARYRLTKRLGLVSLARLIGHRAWLPEGLRGRIARLTCTADYFPSQPFEVDFFGLKYPGDLSNFLDWHVYFFGAYEMDILLLLRSLIRQRSGGVLSMLEPMSVSTPCSCLNMLLTSMPLSPGAR